MSFKNTIIVRRKVFLITIATIQILSLSELLLLVPILNLIFKFNLLRWTKGTRSWWTCLRFLLTKLFQTEWMRNAHTKFDSFFIFLNMFSNLIYNKISISNNTYTPMFFMTDWQDKPLFLKNINFLGPTSNWLVMQGFLLKAWWLILLKYWARKSLK